MYRKYCYGVITVEHPNSHIFVRPKNGDYLGMCDSLGFLWLFGHFGTILVLGGFRIFILVSILVDDSVLYYTISQK